MSNHQTSTYYPKACDGSLINSLAGMHLAEMICNRGSRLVKVDRVRSGSDGKPITESKSKVFVRMPKHCKELTCHTALQINESDGVKQVDSTRNSQMRNFKDGCEDDSVSHKVECMIVTSVEGLIKRTLRKRQYFCPSTSIIVLLWS